MNTLGLATWEKSSLGARYKDILTSKATSSFHNKFEFKRLFDSSRLECYNRLELGHLSRRIVNV